MKSKKQLFSVLPSRSCKNIRGWHCLQERNQDFLKGVGRGKTEVNIINGGLGASPQPPETGDLWAKGSKGGALRSWRFSLGRNKLMFEHSFRDFCMAEERGFIPLGPLVTPLTACNPVVSWLDGWWH